MPDTTEATATLGHENWPLSDPGPSVASTFESSIPNWEKALEVGALGLICATAVVSNFSLWLVVLTTKSLRNESNFLILCLSLADLLVSVVSMPITVATIVSGGWTFPHKMCTALGYINMLAFVSSVESLGVISINRYVKICHPSQFIDIYTTRSVLLMFAGVWLISGIMSLPPLFGWAKYSYLPLSSICFCDWPRSPSYAFFMIACCFCVPCGVMTVCYIRILLAFRQSRKTLQARREEIRLTTSLLVVVALFIVCWFPYCISMFMSIYRPDLSGRALDMTSLLLGYMNSCVNPIVYGLMNKRFKEGYRKLFTKCRFRIG
ncbi:hypothetical protein EGW08_006789, partial [Elysia chlorotica]